MAGKNVFAGGSDVYVKNGSTEFQIVSSTGQLYHKGTALTPTAVEINNLSGEYTVTSETTVANLAANGFSLLSYSTADAKAYTLSAPVTGIAKTIILNTTVVPDTTGIFSSVYTGSTAIFIMDDSTTYAPKLYAGLGPPYSIMELVGVTTALWGIKAAYGNAKFSTSATFST